MCRELFNLLVRVFSVSKLCGINWKYMFDRIICLRKVILMGFGFNTNTCMLYAKVCMVTVMVAYMFAHRLKL